ncbi:MAG TPA: carboxypeptidase regulatory-like domain-containing protein, partial [Verrucomicrobiae bacterium]|nr:carboxypeptidase regulatory-like domain-containing protein [Verrucomicrobiae bacterium]
DLLQSTLDTSLPTFGYSAITYVAPLQAGVPAARLSDPFPASNPLVLPAAKTNGVNSNLGDNVYFYNQNMNPGVNDRFNFSVQRELPGQTHLDLTFFMNFGHNLPYDRDINMADPQIMYNIQGQWDKQVANPFYQYGSASDFPGALRNQPTVSIGSLLKPYPQYSGLIQRATDGVLNRYKAIQLRFQKAFSHGFSYLVAYNYNYEKNYEFFNDVDKYNNHFTFIDNYWPRHRLSAGGSYDLPFGKGRPLLNNLHPILNAIVGGWQTSHLLLINSGQFLRFGQMVTDGSNPAIDNPNRDKWFDTSKFSRPLPYTPRTNPWQYPGVVGPKYWNLDSTLTKDFSIKERVKVEFRFEAYNLTNSFVPTNPDMTVTNSTFGRSTSQQNRGREMQYSLRFQF